MSKDDTSNACRELPLSCKPVSGGKKAVEAGFEVHLAREGISIEMNKVRWYHGFLFVLSKV
jgi:hypothetical protein